MTTIPTQPEIQMAFSSVFQFRVSASSFSAYAFSSAGGTGEGMGAG